VPSQLLPYLVAVALITITPGADTAVVIRNAIARGARAGVLTALGSAAGLLVWGAASAIGIAALLAASSVLFTAVKLAGAAYLIYLGVLSWRLAGHRGERAPTTRDERRDEGLRSCRQGLLTNLSNPKAALFFTALLPQFLTASDPPVTAPAVMTLIAAVASAGWLSLYAYGVGRFGDLLRRPRARRAIDRTTGVVLIVLGVRVAFERR
jgi:RhtB (resistance to homoserine/threonine) family protein